MIFTILRTLIQLIFITLDILFLFIIHNVIILNCVFSKVGINQEVKIFNFFRY